MAKIEGFSDKELRNLVELLRSGDKYFASKNIKHKSIFDRMSNVDSTNHKIIIAALKRKAYTSFEDFHNVRDTMFLSRQLWFFVDDLLHNVFKI